MGVGDVVQGDCMSRLTVDGDRSLMESTPERRVWCYVQRPIAYEIAGCPKCGLADCDWSEYAHHCWCPKCVIDFIPEH